MHSPTADHAAQPTGRIPGGLLDAVRDAFPDLRWRDVIVPDQGLDHDVVILAHPAHVPGLPRAAAPDRIVVRRATADRVTGRADLEARVIAAVTGRAPAMLPRTLATDGDSLSLAAFVPGTALTAGVWASLDDAHRRAIARDLAATLDVLHALPADGPPADEIGPSWFGLKHSRLTAGVDEHVLPVLDARDAAAARAILDEAAETFLVHPAAPRPIHGDLHEAHLLWDGRSGRIGVIDFSDMTVADPAIDVAHLPGISPRLFDGVVSALAGADPDLPRRAAIYARWDAVYLLADHVITGRTPETTARALFGRAVESVRGR